MAVILALGGALMYGCADFCGGLAARRTHVVSVALLGQCAGLAILVPAIVLVPGRPDAASVAWGAAGGLAGAVGLMLLYRSLATGAMAVVAPVTAVTAAAVPVMAGLGLGERPSLPALAGVVAAAFAVLLISAEGGRVPSRRELRGSGTLTALAAGFAFGLLFVLLSRSSDESGMWPLAGTRVASIALLLAVTAVLRQGTGVHGRSALLAVAAGAGDMGANVLFLLATREGLLSITGVLISLYPAATVVLAVTVLRERLAGLQLAGLGVAAAAVTVIALA